MKMKDLLLLLLTIIFVILSIFYIVSVCNYDIKELFIDKYSAIGKKCNLDNILGQFNNLRSNAKYTSEILRDGNVIEDYHTDYKCDNDNYGSLYLTKYIDVKNRDLLLAYSCIKIKPSKLISDITDINPDNLHNNSYKVMLTEPDKTYVEYANIGELTNKIGTKIKNIIRETSLLNTSTNYLYFPIYVFISQAPYIKNANENIKVTDSNRGANGTNYDSCSTNYTIKNNDICSATFRMKAEVAIIFLGLTRAGGFITDVNVVNRNIIALRDRLSHHSSKSKQCFLKCATDNNKQACGCLNMPGSYNINDKTYNSVCLTNNQETSMTMVYFVNPYADTYSDEKYVNGGDPTSKTDSLLEFRWYGTQK
jgi:hypothetical protein